MSVLPDEQGPAVITSPPAASDAHPATYDRVPSRTVAPHAPAWFHEAVAQPATVGAVPVEGTDIRYLSWGPDHGPATVLVHGGAAHAMWWAPLAALLDPTRRVVAMDMSGHGISGHRPSYTGALWGREIAAVAAATSEGPATVVGHSLGGIVLAHEAHERGEEFERVVLVDSPVWERAPAPEGALAREPGRAARTYPDLASALSRFRLVPEQPCANQWYVDHIARHGLVHEDGAWRWRFDPEVFAGPEGARQLVRFSGDLSGLACPWAVVVGDRSYLADGARQAFGTGPGSPLHMVRDAAHHVMLDQPLPLLATLRDVLIRR